MLTVTIPEKYNFYSLYASGIFSRKVFIKGAEITEFSFEPGSVIFLYYAYPSHREACVVRYTGGGNAVPLPGLSKKVSPLLSVQASKTDKLRRAEAFLNKNFHGAYRFPDGFYIRLFYILCQKGKINYPALRRLAEASLPPITNR